jgi:hypothetical protein
MLLDLILVVLASVEAMDIWFHSSLTETLRARILTYSSVD